MVFHQKQSNSENSKIAFSYLVLSLSSSEWSIHRLRNRPSQVPSSPSHCLDMKLISFSKPFGNRSPLGKSSVSQAESVLTFISRVIRQVSRRQCAAVSVFHLVGSFRSVGGNKYAYHSSNFPPQEDPLSGRVRIQSFLCTVEGKLYSGRTSLCMRTEVVSLLYIIPPLPFNVINNL